jgi:hypothetical protein
METLTAKDREFIAALRAVVAEFGPDHVYERGAGGACEYVRDDQPSCLIGQALHRIGVDLDFLDEREGNGASDVMRDVRGFSTIVMFGADDAQGAQDNFYTWGEALSRFENRLPS